MILKQYINNNYFSNEYLKDDFPKAFDNKDLRATFENIKKLYKANNIQKLNESQLEHDFIEPILRILGYEVIPQLQKKVQGKTYKIDFALFGDEKAKQNHDTNNKSSNKNILLFCENKAYKEPLDNNKIDESNPHFQLIRYLTSLKVDYGFLCNGKYFRFYDISKNASDKVFFEIDLEQIILDDNKSAFEYFYHVFKKDNFARDDKNQKKIDEIKKQSNKAKIKLEDDLKEVIYGKSSMVYKIGKPNYCGLSI